jgi:OOP family OmpA-OmpF porin
MTANVAVADDETYQGSWYLMPTLGAMHADSDLETDGTDAAYGVRLGKVLSEHWDVQLGLTRGKADASSTIAGFASTGDYKQTILGLDALYMFSRDKFRPFVLAGLGLAHNDLDYTVGGVAVTGSETSWMANVGAGVQYFVTDNIGLQADLRHVWSKAEANVNAFGISTDETIGNTYLNFGVIFNFGAPKQLASAAPAPVEPAPAAMAEVAPQEEQPLPPMTEAPAAEAVGPAPAAFEKMTLQAEVLFAFDKDTLKDSGKKILDTEVVEKMRAHPEVELVLITGHTDRIGDENYNQKLSERRAQQVKKYIASQGIDAARLHAVGKGEKEPVADCKGVRGKKLIECLQPNRRVVVEIEAQRQPAQ